ncbi:MAG: tRNA preQ1(34) S-adenosylmethionine ribosyltransferase-isomerase QueA [Balneolaceae bacterium]
MRSENSRYTLQDFDYDLPKERIAQFPAAPRDHSRLLVYNRESGQIQDDFFYNLPNHLPGGTTLVANNSRVEKCRLLFDNGSVEIFVTRVLDERTVEALVRPGRKFRLNRIAEPAPGITAEVLDISEDGLRTLRLDPPLGNVAYDAFRTTPFPPYIEQDESLANQYQTVYARNEGSKAAPTAGLHFTERLINQLREQGVGWEEVTLHVGLGTFAPVKSERIDDHVMHREWYQISANTAGRLNEAVHRTAVGTTAIRVLESASDDQGQLAGSSGETDIFITPGYTFRATDAMVTNFHLPKSTLLMLVSAFVGLEETRRIYRHAIQEEYRFYSFGDAMLLL